MNKIIENKNIIWIDPKIIETSERKNICFLSRRLAKRTRYLADCQSVARNGKQNKKNVQTLRALNPYRNNGQTDFIARKNA